MSITNERLDEVQGRLDASTWTPEEPWHVRWTWGGYGPNYVARCEDDEIVKVTGDLPSKEDSRLIGKAPQDLADLLAEVHRLRAELAKVREVTEDKVGRAKRAFGAATAVTSSIPLGMSEHSFIQGVAIQHGYAIRIALQVVLGGGDDE